MSKKIVWGLLLLSFVGIVLGVISTQHFMHIQKAGLDSPSFCTLSAFIDCDVVALSRYAVFLGVPTGGWGILFYTWSVVMSLSLLWATDKTSLAAKGLFASWLAVAYSALMAYLSLGVLHVLCLVCAGIYLVNVLLLIVWRGATGRWIPDASLWRQMAYPLGVAVALFGVGGLTMHQAYARVSGVSSEDVATVTNLFFRSSQYDLTIPEGAPVWGNPDGKITIVEFSDFQCPYCKEAAFHFKPFLQEFKDDVRLIFLQFPLDASCNPGGGMHTQACTAAKAAVCAQAKGDFWNFHDDLFRNQKDLNPEKILQLAVARGWPEAEFKACIDSPDTLKRVQEDIVAGHKVHVDSTPTVLVNNRRFKYWRFPEVVRSVLKKIKKED